MGPEVRDAWLITTKKWIILTAASNQAKDLTGPIAMASIRRYYVDVTVIKAVEQTTGVGEIEKRKSLPRKLH